MEPAVSFRLGVFLAQEGHLDSAREHFQRPSELSSANCTYRRQAWNFLGADRESIVAGILDPNAPAFYPALGLGTGLARIGPPVGPSCDMEGNRRNS